MARSTPNYREPTKRTRKSDPAPSLDLVRDGLGYFTEACRTVASVTDNEFRQSGKWPTVDRVAYYIDHRLNDIGKRSASPNRAANLNKWIRDVGGARSLPAQSNLAPQHSFMVNGDIVIALEGSAMPNTTSREIDSLANDLTTLADEMRGQTILRMAACNAVTRLNRVVAYRHRIDSGQIEQRGVGDSAKFLFVGTSGSMELLTREKAQALLGIRIVDR